MKWIRQRLERIETRNATRRLRQFRVGEVERLREDAMRFTLSEAVTMASIRREVAALIGDNSGRVQMFMERGRLIHVQSEKWHYEIIESRCKATIQKEGVR